MQWVHLMLNQFLNNKDMADRPMNALQLETYRKAQGLSRSAALRRLGESLVEACQIAGVCISDGHKRPQGQREPPEGAPSPSN